MNKQVASAKRVALGEAAHGPQLKSTAEEGLLLQELQAALAAARARAEAAERSLAGQQSGMEALQVLR